MSNFITWAQAIDKLRIVPRIFFAAYFSVWLWITTKLLLWYLHLPAAERTYEASGFGSVIFLTATKFLHDIFDTYSKNANDWTQTMAGQPGRPQ
jgi:hypothetical protein